MYNADVNSYEYQEAYRRAERRVKAKLGFYWHLASYVIVNGLLIGIYLLTTIATTGFYYPWFVWPMAGWGIGLMFHFLGVYVFPSADNAATRQRMIEEEMRRMGAQVPPPGTSWPGASNKTDYTERK
jgi:hypothetical protein